MKISEHGVAPTEDRCRAFWDAKPPANAKELHSYLGLAQYSSRFIYNFSTLVEPLWELIKKGIVWKWEETEQRALERLKAAISTKAMSYFNKDWETTLIVDASPVGLGAVLTQSRSKVESDRRVVAFASRLLTGVETRYSQCEKEALAAVWGCEKFWLYIYGKKFRLVTDNRAVELIFRNPNSNPPARIQRWALRLMEFDYEIVHCPGSTNIADYFLRQPIKSIDWEARLDAINSEAFINTIVSNALPRALSLDEIIEHTNKDSELVNLREWIRQASSGKLPETLGEYKHVMDELSITEKGIILRNSQIVIPKQLRKQILELAHAGHQGITKTKALIRSRVWFPGIDSRVEKMIRECINCQVSDPKRTYEPMVPSSMPAGPWMQVSGDFFGPLDDGSLWYLNWDDYSRWGDVKRITSNSAQVVAVILEELFGVLGIPAVYRSDNGPPFNSHAFSEFAARLGFKYRKITPYWPRGNAEAE